jgi:hypothetical protein
MQTRSKEAAPIESNPPPAFPGSLDPSKPRQRANSPASMLHQPPSDLEILQYAIEIVIQLLNRPRLSIRMAIALHHHLLLLLPSILVLVVLIVNVRVLGMRNGNGGFGRRRPLGRRSGCKGRVDGCGIVWAVLIGRRRSIVSLGKEA